MNRAIQTTGLATLTLGASAQRTRGHRMSPEHTHGGSKTASFIIGIGREQDHENFIQILFENPIIN